MKYYIRTFVLAAIALYSIQTASAGYISKAVAEEARDLMRSGDVKMTQFEPGTSYAKCFTLSDQDCEGMIVQEINSAKRIILMQAYSFTSSPIAKALAAAKERGVDVRAILDKSQRTERYTGATFLRNAGIPVVIDERPTIAHSKVMVFDNQTVLTGSFNFTKAAQEKNAENLIIIKGDSNLVHAYTENWKNRFAVSVPF